MENTLRAGAAQVDITPKNSQFLFGYPHVKRYSTGVHDPLYSCALYLSDGQTQVLFIANDIIFVGKDVVCRARKRIEKLLGIPTGNIMITSTHTHSGPITVDYISNEADPVVPKADQKYVQFTEDSIVAAAEKAVKNAQPAKIGLAIADDTGVGTNRRDPNGPADHNVPVVMVKSLDDKNIACMLVCSMHPTVLHEDSTLISGDFPGLARIYLQENVLGKDCPVLHHTGPSGNQSPRHVTKANTFEQANRLGEILGAAIEKVLPAIEYKEQIRLATRQDFIADLPKRTFPSVLEAQAQLEMAIHKLQDLQDSKASAQDVRTAECDWFGAEETLTLAKAAKDQRLEKGYACCLPVEIQVIKIGDWNFAGWQGEIFTDYGLEIKDKSENTFVISLANGELQGYIVTSQAAKEGGYESSNALFSHESGQIIVDKTIELLKG